MNGRSDLEKEVMGLRRKASPEADERILNDTLAAFREAEPRGMTVRARLAAFGAIAASVVLLAGILIGIRIAPEMQPSPEPTIAVRPEAAVEQPPAPEPPPAPPVAQEPPVTKTAEQMLAEGDIEGLLEIVGQTAGDLDTKLTAAVYLAQIGDLETAQKLDNLGAASGDKQLAVLLGAIADQIRERLAEEKTFALADRTLVKYRGIVTDANDRPIEGVEVKSILWPSFARMARPETAAYTDTDGRFETSPLNFGENRLLVFDHPTYALGWWEPKNIADRVKMVLFPAREAAGRVIDANANGIAEAKVTAHVYEDARYSNMGHHCYVTAVTDTLGRFVIRQLFEGAQLRLAAVKEGYTRYLTQGYGKGEFPVKAGDADITIVLEVGGFIGGRLLHNGKPYENEGIIVDVMGTGGEVFGVTDNEGRFEILGLAAPKGLYAPVDIGLRMRSLVGTGLAGRPLLDVPVRRGEATIVDVELLRSVQVTLQLVNSLTGEAVERKGLTVRGVGAGTTDEVGQWAFSAAPGEYVLSIEEWTGAGAEQVEHVFTVAAGAEQRLVEIAVAERPMIRGVLVDEAGTPVEGNVYMGQAEGRTGGYGIFEIPEPNYVGVETYVGYAFSADNQRGRAFIWNAQDRPAGLLIDVAPLASIVGQVVDANGAPIEDLAPKLGIVLPDGQIREIQREFWETTLQGDGWFRIDGVPTGLAMALYFRSLKEPTVLQIPAMRQARVVEVGQIVLDWMSPAGTLAEWDGVLAGVVMDERGQAIPEAKITAAIGSRTFFDYSGLDGQFAIPGLPRGERVSVSVRAIGYAQQSFEAIVDDQPIEVMLLRERL